jgi:hypothetical protein
MKDYDASLSMYKLIRGDYKNNHALLHYASIHEMMALCVHLIEPLSGNNEVFQYMQTALINYIDAAEEGRGALAGASQLITASVPARLATRLCLVLSSLKTNNTQSRYVDIANLLASVSVHETSLCRAVLLEQSSANYYHAGMYRKYALHMVAAGNMFRAAHLEHHAVRCFTAALYIYNHEQWDELLNRLLGILADQLYSLGRMAIAAELYAKLVGTSGGGQVSAKSQQKFVNRLLDICKNHTKKAIVAADRMAASTLNGSRDERLKRVAAVKRGTKAARSVLELPNLDLPFLDNSSLTIQVEAEARESNQNIASLGTTSKGEDSVWQELQIHTVEELRAPNKSARKPNANDMSRGVTNSADPLIRRMIYEIDCETKELNLVARAKELGSMRPQPAVRARMEPLHVEFEMSNPLAIKVIVNEMQLVAIMKETGTGRVCTNEDAIALGPTPAKTWTFDNSDSSFMAPDFCRLAPVGGRRSWKSAKGRRSFLCRHEMQQDSRTR